VWRKLEVAAWSIVVFVGLIGKSHAGGHLLVRSRDYLFVTNPPPDAKAILDGGADSRLFGASTYVEFKDLAVGVHTVVVEAAEGYYPLEDTNLAGQVQNLDSAYGNPQRVGITNDEWTTVSLDFMPYFEVTAVVRDEWTSERLEGVKIEFVAGSGRIDGEIYDGYPNYASYESNWFSCVDGGFPAQVFLPPVDWDIRLSNTGYRVWTQTNGIMNVAAGDTVDLGTLHLVPIDVNSNAIGDHWEQRFFSLNPKQSGGEDADGDGHSNLQEYYVGTDPTNPLSCFFVERIHGRASNGVWMCWSTAQWRTYRITGRNEINDTSAWQHVDGLWESTNGQRTMTWRETNLPDRAHVYYRVQVVPHDLDTGGEAMLYTGESGGGGESMITARDIDTPKVWTVEALKALGGFYEETLLPLLEAE
jgi:hypothetical protein